MNTYYYSPIYQKALTIIYILIFCSASNSSNAEIVFNEDTEQKLDLLFSKNHNDQQPGLSALISHNGKPLYHKQFGLANMEYDIKVDNTTKFAIGSITKQFTAAAIMMLNEQGKLKTTDFIGTHLPLFPTDKFPITIENLLTHTSGLVDYPQVKSIRNQLRNNLSPITIIKEVIKQPLLFQPHDKVAYSNTGYVILGLIIEQISGQSYAEFLNQHIFLPTQMHNTTVAHYTDIIDHRANGYAIDEDRLINATHHSSSFSAGAIVSTAEDLNKWITALNNHQIINKYSLERMYANHTVSNGTESHYGYGWEHNNVAGIKTIEHSGFETGFKANSLFIPDENLFVVVLQNSQFGSPTPAMIKSAAIILNKPYPEKYDHTVLTKKQQLNLIGHYQLHDGKKIILSNENDQLFYNVLGGLKKPLYVKNNNTLYFDDGYKQLHFEGQKITYSNRGMVIKGQKYVNQEHLENVAVSISEEVLSRYVGHYQLHPFIMKITLENGRLFAQPEGEDKLPMQAKSIQQFFIKEIGAEIEFLITDDIQTINIILEGNQLSGSRI